MRFLYEEEGQKREYQLHDGEVRIGRDPSCEIVTANRSVSRKHLVCVVKGATVIVKDENSGNGMFVNDVRMPEAVLKNGDVLRAGKFALSFEAERASDGTMIDTGGANQDKTMVDAGVAAAPPPRRAASPAQVAAAGHKTEHLGDVQAELARVAAAPPPPKKPKPAAAEPGPPGKLKIVKGMPASVTDLKGRVSLGTHDDNSVILTGDGISRNHSEIVARDGKWVVRDLASRNGTWVNGKKVDEHVLADGDTIQIGSVQFSFASGASSAANASGPGAAAGVPASARPANPAAAKKKRLVLVAGGGILILVLILFAGLAMMKTPDDAGKMKEDPKAAMNKKVEEAWGEFEQTIGDKQYQGAAEALEKVRGLYGKLARKDEEVKAWKKVVDMFLNAGDKCKNFSGTDWDSLKGLLDDAARCGEFESALAQDRSGWVGRRKEAWQHVSKAQENESKNAWADAVAEWSNIDAKDSCYADMAKEGIKNAKKKWREEFNAKLNQLETSGEYEDALNTYRRMCKDFEDARNDKSLYERSARWQGNVEASRHVKAAQKLLDKGDYDGARKEIAQAISSEPKLQADIKRITELADCGDRLGVANDLYKKGKTDEAIAALGEVSDQSPLLPLKTKIQKMAQMYKDAQAAEKQKDFATAKRWWTEMVSTEEDKDNLLRQEAERKSGFDPVSQANTLVDQADEKIRANDWAGARTLAEQALTFVQGHEGAQKLIKSIVDEGVHRYQMLYAKQSQMDAAEALKQAQEILKMLRASDTYYKKVSDLIDALKKKIDQKHR